jgi:hypothetical protein
VACAQLLDYFGAAVSDFIIVSILFVMCLLERTSLLFNALGEVTYFRVMKVRIQCH